MIVRLVAEYRRGSELRSPGELVDLELDEATMLIEVGRALPVTERELAAETRSRVVLRSAPLARPRR